MNQILDPPNTYDFGLNFNYAVWVPGTTVTLVNVPWNNDYRDVVEFPNKGAVNTYINSIQGAGVTVEHMSYAKPNEPVRLNLPFNAVQKYNYLRASNPVQPVPGGDFIKDYYYFVTNVTYIAPNTTEVTIQLDIWTTYRFDVTFGNCYIERGHIGIANSQAFANYGRDYLTIPEGLDVGSEYSILNTTNNNLYNGPLDQAVLVVSSVDLEIDPGTVEVPALLTATGGTFAGVPSGATQYIFNSVSDFQSWLGVRQNAPWITQGILSITLIPSPGRYDKDYVPQAFDGTPNRMVTTAYGYITYPMLANWRESQEIVDHIGPRYAHLYKLWTAPYMTVELTTFSGTPISIKPESWADDDATVMEMASVAQPNPRIAFMPKGYNAQGTSGLVFEQGEFLDFATYIMNFPTLAILNNSAIGYLASNANSLAYQHSSADWSQQRALTGNQTSYDQSTGAINTATDQNTIGRTADANSTQLGMDNSTAHALVNSVAGPLNGLQSGSPLGIIGGLSGAVTGNINTLIDKGTTSAQLSVRNAAANAGTARSNQQSALVRDTNKGLADFSAKGDYANAIAGINAKVRDAALIQPTTSGQVGGDTFNLAHDLVSINARFKMIDKASIRAVGEYWLRYGYAVRMFSTLPASLMVMSKFSYWKLSETYIRSATMPEGFKQVFRGILEKGVTVWANPDDIGVIDIADNQPLGGITL